MTETRIHKLRANALRMSDDEVMFSYDCQKKLVMECSKDKHNKENTFLYVWEKNEPPK